MRKILLSIHPVYVDLIAKGVKKYEYRTKVSSETIDCIYIYETSPVKKVIGEAKVLRILKDSPEKLRKKTQKLGGITKKDFDAYFCGKEIGFAYELGNITIYEEPLQLGLFGVKFPPQSFIYID